MSTPAPPTLTRVAEGVWTARAPVSILGTRLETTMTVLRVGDALLVHSPVPLTAALGEATAALGPVAHLYAPNNMHHLWIGEWAAAWPGARLHAPSALRRKRPELRIDRIHGEGARPHDDLEEVPVQGFRLDETVLFHRPSASLVVADLVHQIGRPPGLWTRAYSRAMGFYDRVALSRALRLAAFSDKRAARRSVDALLALPFERIVVGHGTPVESDARGALAAAYAWLR